MVRSFSAGSVPLSGDEAYYWQWSRHLALGYYDHPPLVAWLIAAAELIFGRSGVSVRMAAILLSAGTMILTWRLIYAMTRNEAICTIGILPLVIVPVFAVLSLVVTPDAPLLFSWAWFLYAGWSAITGNGQPVASVAGSTPAPVERMRSTPPLCMTWSTLLPWLSCGAALGMGLLSKFTAFLFPPVLFLFLICKKQHRGWLRRPEPYLAILLGALIVSPFLFWNATHNWETFRYQLADRHAPSRVLHPGDLLSHFTFQAAGVSPLFFFLLAGVWGASLRASLKGDERHLFCFLASTWFLGFFTAASVLVKPAVHWSIPGYLPLFVSLALYLSTLRKKLFTGAYLVASVSALLITAFLHLIILKPQMVLHFLTSTVISHERVNQGKRIESGILGEIYGYHELGKRVADLRREMEKNHPVFIISDSYALSSVLAFYSGEETHVILGSNIGREYSRWDRYEKMIGLDSIYVDVMPLEKRPDIEKALRSSFQSLIQEAPLEVRRDGTTVKTFYLTRCYSLRTPHFN